LGSYVGRHAEYYDSVYADKPYAQEAAFVSERIQKHAPGARRLLELACGSGRHAFELEKLGYQILATDYSRDLLSVARRSAAASGSQVQFELQDMRTLDLATKDFDAAYCLFDSIGYVQTNQAIKETVERVHGHLKKSGLFVFEFWHASAMLRNYEPRRERTWQFGESKLTRVSSTELDVQHQLARVSYTFEEIQPDGTRLTLEEMQVNRYFLVQEMALFIAESGFSPLEWAPAYAGGAIDADTWHILCVAQKE
jgi:SAM-dependent methyltransferase